MNAFTNEALLGDLVVLFDSLHKTPKSYVEEGYPMIRVTDIQRGSLRTDGTMRVDEKTYEEFSKKYKPEIGDIVLSRVGSYGNSVIVTNGERFCLGQNTVCLSPIRNKVFPHYLYCCLNSRSVLSQFDSFITGASQPTISLKNIRAVRIPLPSIKIQRRVSQIISAYDDLIENNRRRILLLEQAARLLYKEWFVHLRYPGHEHAQIIDGVPEGWEKKKIAEVCETIGGGTPSTKVSEYWDGDITWVVPSDITNNNSLILLKSERKITEKGLRESSAKLVPAESILMTSRASVGFFALMDHEVCTNQGFINIVPHDNQSRMFLLFNLLSRVNEIRSNAKGTTYPEISKGRFREMDIIIPSKTLMQQFGEIACDVIRQVRCLMRSNMNLAKARDLLLPKLMNGEVAV
jgi:type I restriction enzyme S subunit